MLMLATLEDPLQFYLEQTINTGIQANISKLNESIHVGSVKLNECMNFYTS